MGAFLQLIEQLLRNHNFNHGARCGSFDLHQHGGTSMFEEIFFPETLGDIEQRHLSSSGNGIFAILRNSAPLEAPCENAPTISSALSGF
jgi:hypothetical protein